MLLNIHPGSNTRSGNRLPFWWMDVLGGYQRAACLITLWQRSYSVMFRKITTSW